jgi:hypothetical protein
MLGYRIIFQNVEGDILKTLNPPAVDCALHRLLFVDL